MLEVVVQYAVQNSSNACQIVWSTEIIIVDFQKSLLDLHLTIGLTVLLQKATALGFLKFFCSHLNPKPYTYLNMVFITLIQRRGRQSQKKKKKKKRLDLNMPVIFRPSSINKPLKEEYLTCLKCNLSVYELLETAETLIQILERMLESVRGSSHDRGFVIHGAFLQMKSLETLQE